MLKIKSKLKNKLLNYFFLNETATVYVNELARLINGDPKNVYRALLEFEQDGLLLSEYKSRVRIFRANTESILYKEYKTIFLKTSGIEEMLKNSLKDIEGLKEAYIFGSYASGKYNAQSDIDLLLIGKHKRLNANKALFDIGKSCAREINIVHMSIDDFIRKRKNKEQFIAEIFKNPVKQIL